MIMFMDVLHSGVEQDSIQDPIAKGHYVKIVREPLLFSSCVQV